MQNLVFLNCISALVFKLVIREELGILVGRNANQLGFLFPFSVWSQFLPVICLSARKADTQTSLQTCVLCSMEPSRARKKATRKGRESWKELNNEPSQSRSAMVKRTSDGGCWSMEHSWFACSTTSLTKGIKFKPDTCACEDLIGSGAYLCATRFSLNQDTDRSSLNGLGAIQMGRIVFRDMFFSASVPTLPSLEKENKSRRRKK